MAVEVRPCAGVDELADALAVIGQFFGMGRDLDNAERFTNWLDMGRMHAAWEDGRIVGGAGAFGFDVSVPRGARVPWRRRGGWCGAADASPPPPPDGDDALAAR